MPAAAKPFFRSAHLLQIPQWRPSIGLMQEKVK